MILYIIVAFLLVIIYEIASELMRSYWSTKNKLAKATEQIETNQKQLIESMIRMAETKAGHDKIQSEYRNLLEQISILKRDNDILRQDRDVKTIILEKELALIKMGLNDEWIKIKAEVVESHKMITEGIDRIKLEYQISATKMIKNDVERSILFRTLWKQVKVCKINGKKEIDSYLDVTKLMLWMVKKFQLTIDGENSFIDSFRCTKNKLKCDVMFDNKLILLEAKNYCVEGSGANHYNVEHELILNTNKYVSKLIKIKDKINEYTNVPIEWCITTLPQSIVDDYTQNVKEHVTKNPHNKYSEGYLPGYLPFDLFRKKYNITHIKYKLNYMCECESTYNNHLGNHRYYQNISKCPSRSNLYFIDKYSWFFIDSDFNIQPFLF